MKIDRKWAKPVALALAIPSSSLGVGMLVNMAVNRQWISKKVGVIIFIVFLGHLLFGLVYHGIKSQDQ